MSMKVKILIEPENKGVDAVKDAVRLGEELKSSVVLGNDKLKDVIKVMIDTSGCE